MTLLGGEPFDQAAALADLAELVRAGGLSVMTFTGFELSHLQLRARQDVHVRRLIEATDLLIDGPYLADQADLVRPWVGSRNQGFHFLTNRYKHLESQLHQLDDKLEIHVGADGSVSVNGWATVDRLEALLDSDVLKMPNRGRVR